MAEISAADRDTILRMLFGGTLYLGLARSQQEAGATPRDEETDANYRRRAVTLSEPQGDGVRYVTNEEPIIFPEYRAPAAQPITHAFLATEQEGGVVKWSDRIQQPEQQRAGGIIFFPAGELQIGVP